MNKVEPIKQDWLNQRCRPEVMPFAGIINAPPGTSKFEFTNKNFKECTVIILSSIVGHALKPVYYTTDVITKIMTQLLKAVNAIRFMINYIRMKLMNIFSYIFARIANVMIPLQNILIKISYLMLLYALA